MAHNLNSVLHIVIVQFRFFFVLWSAREKQILRLFISFHFQWHFSTDQNARQSFQADDLAYL